MKPSLSSDSEERSGVRGGGTGNVRVGVRRASSSSATSSISGDGSRYAEATARGWRCLPFCTAGLQLECEDCELGSSRVYVRPGQPRSGRAQELGETTMGERSYNDEEYAENVWAREFGEGGKWTPWDGGVLWSTDARGYLGVA